MNKYIGRDLKHIRETPAQWKQRMLDNLNDRIERIKVDSEGVFVSERLIWDVMHPEFSEN